jgi:hypothetical protein
MQKLRGVIQTKRSRTARRKKLLEITQRDPRFGCHLARAEIRRREAVLDDIPDTGKQPVRVA